MTWMKIKHADVKDLYIDRKMWGILLVFVVLGFFLVGTLIIATNTLSGLRAYSTMQVYWMEARISGTNTLIRFLETGDEKHLDEFENSFTLIRDARYIRTELLNESPDYDLVREKLLAIHTRPKDVKSMITTFERLHAIEHFSDAVQIWNESEAIIQQLEQIADQISTETAAGELDQQKSGEYVNRIESLNNQISQYKGVVAAGLSDGTRLLQSVIIWLSILLFGIFMLSGFLLSYRFLDSIKGWARILEISEQRYKSLFEHNPNAVFSISRKGRIESGNEAFTRLSGYAREDIEFRKIDMLSVPGEGETIQGKLETVFKGHPQSFETKWRQQNGKEIPLHITILPIYVDDKIEGAFSIAEDISYQKYAENKIRKQLDEKIFLLSEVHDRVKNNLALIMSILQLQEQYIDDKKARDYLDKTILRIKSMAMVHERVYKNESFANVRVDEFIRDLADFTRKTSRQEKKELELNVQTVPFTLDIKKAIPFGMLTNELVTNAAKHAFNGQKYRKMSITLMRDGEHIDLIIQDNGKGLTNAFDFEGNSETNLGMILIKTLIKQLDGKLEYNTDKESEVKIRFMDTFSSIQKDLTV